MTRAVNNPVQLDDAEVRSRFIVRDLELGDLLTHLREDDPPRHALVIGQRGMGKSLLLRRLTIAVRDDPELHPRWLPVLMPEELYEVTSLGDLWMAALDQVARAERDEGLAEQYAALLREPDGARLEALALQRLLGAGRSRGRRLLLLTENLGMLLGDQVEDADRWALRQTLQTENGLLLVATAVTSFAQVEHAGEAFYGFFHRVDLDPLGDDDVRTLWHDLTGIELAGDRVVPIRVLTGGNPRLVSVLGQFSHRADLRGLRESLELLIDEYTPYFKANIEALPTVERKVFVTLADIWAPATAAEVAERARMSSSKASSLLGRLARRGAVRTVHHEGKQRYELTERLYNLYHLLRRPDGEGRVRALIDILTHLYEPVVLERDILPAIVQPAPDAPPLTRIDASIAGRLGRHLEMAGVWTAMQPAELRHRIPMLEDLLATQRDSVGDDDPDTLLTRYLIAYCISRGGDPATGLRLAQELLPDQERICGRNGQDTFATRYLIGYFTGVLGDPRGALELYRALIADAVDVPPEDPILLAARNSAAYHLGELGDPRAALDAYREVFDARNSVLGPDHPSTLASLLGMASMIGELGDVEEARTLFRKLAEDCARVVGPDSSLTLSARHQLATFTARAGDVPTALALLSDLAADRIRILGKDDLETLATRHSVAVYTGRTGDPQGEHAQLRAVVADASRRWGHDHPSTLHSRLELARATYDLDNPRGALAQLETLLPEVERVLGLDNPLALLVRRVLTVIVANTGDVHRARTLARELVQDHERVLGRDHADAVAGTYLLAAITAKAGDVAEAARLVADLVPRVKAHPRDTAIADGVRALQAFIATRLDAHEGKPLPRELREALDATIDAAEGGLPD